MDTDSTTPPEVPIEAVEDSSHTSFPFNSTNNPTKPTKTTTREPTTDTYTIPQNLSSSSPPAAVAMEISSPLHSPITADTTGTSFSPAQKPPSRFSGFIPPHNWNQRFRRFPKPKDLPPPQTDNPIPRATPEGFHSNPETTIRRSQTHHRKEFQLACSPDSKRPSARELMNYRIRMSSLPEIKTRRLIPDIKRPLPVGSLPTRRSPIPKNWPFAVVIEARSNARASAGRISKRTSKVAEHSLHAGSPRYSSSPRQERERDEDNESIGSLIVVARERTPSPSRRMVIPAYIMHGESWKNVQNYVVEGKHRFMSPESLQRIEEWLRDIRDGGEGGQIAKLLVRSGVDGKIGWKLGA